MKEGATAVFVAGQRSENLENTALDIGERVVPITVDP